MVLVNSQLDRRPGGGQLGAELHLGRLRRPRVFDGDRRDVPRGLLPLHADEPDGTAGWTASRPGVRDCR